MKGVIHSLTYTQLETLAKKLKKNNVNVDIVSFGEESNNTKLQTFITTVDRENSR